MLHCTESIFIIEYLRKYEFIFKTALAHESEDPGVLMDEKNCGSKISCYCPFKGKLPRKCGENKGNRTKYAIFLNLGQPSLLTNG
jgi:hypothetical protein